MTKQPIEARCDKKYVMKFDVYMRLIGHLVVLAPPLIRNKEIEQDLMESSVQLLNFLHERHGGSRVKIYAVYLDDSFSREGFCATLCWTYM